MIKLIGELIFDGLLFLGCLWLLKGSIILYYGMSVILIIVLIAIMIMIALNVLELGKLVWQRLFRKW